LGRALGRTPEEWGGEWGWIFGLSFAFLPVGMLLSGRLADGGRTRLALAIGAVCLAGGWFLAGYADRVDFMHPLHWLWLTYGALLSIGGGCSYGVVVGAAVRWFPDRRGLASGIVVGALGFGAFLFAFMMDALLARYGVMGMFKICGGVFAVLMGLGACVIVNPPAGYVPAGFTLPRPRAGAPAAGEGLEWREMLRRGRFWLLYAVYFCGAFAGLLVISMAKGAALARGSFDEAAAVLAVSVVGLANSGGRVLWGWISDRWSRANAVACMTLLSAAAMALLALAGGPLAVWTGFVTVALCFGGVLGVFPSLGAEAFGVKRAAMNYAFLFTAFSLAALAAPQAAAWFRTDGAVDYAAAFRAAAVVAAAGFALALFARRTARRAAV
jgi:OFA family oxalate/formate antiporter-like MFS transporter